MVYTKFVFLHSKWTRISQIDTKEKTNSMCILKIPPALKANLEGFEFLSSFLPEVNEKVTKEKELFVDFSDCTSIDGNLAAVLGALLDKSLPISKKVMIGTPRNNTVRKILARNHFLRAWSVDTNVEERENYVKYAKFKSDVSAKEFKTYIQEGLIKKQKFPQHTDLAGEKIVESIYEIYANAVTHGGTDYVYSCGEYKEEAHRLDMTIIDCGQTIPGNVNDFFAKRNQLTIGDCEAIEWAFVSGNTTKNQTGGLGLAIIKDFIALNKGSIQVVSGRGFIEYRGDQVEQFLLNTPFAGTIVNVKFNFDDNNKYYMTSERQPFDKNDLL